MCSFENQPKNILHRETRRADAEDWKGEGVVKRTGKDYAVVQRRT